jgi:chorismate synthase
MNSFGRVFRVQIYGESHGDAIGIIIDGCPAGIPIETADFNSALDKRKSGKMGTTKRNEDDKVIILSGIFNGYTNGAPINLLIHNVDVRSSDYDDIKNTPRPGHADFTAYKKYSGYNDYRGGGHFSGRLTAALVLAGVIANKIIPFVIISAKVTEIGGYENFEDYLTQIVESGDSIGGLVECSVLGLPIGLGEPFFDSVESVISHAVFAIPAIKGIEFGAGFKSTRMRGSEMNDEIKDATGTTMTNNSGGINGGITNGNPLTFRIAVKPASSINKSQSTINFETGEPQIITVKGRHDACIALRVPPVLEAVTSIALADLYLLNKINY